MLDCYEGPLGVLLNLIRSQKLDICEVSLVRVADQFLAYAADLRRLDLDLAGEFFVLAATLMEIKSRVLLPRPDTPLDEEQADPRAELIARLMEYERYQKLGELLRERLASYQRGFGRGATDEWTGPVPLRELKPADLILALSRLAGEGEEALPPPRALRVRRQAIQLQAAVEGILAALEPNCRVSFAGILRERLVLDRTERLVYFLALLELVRMRRVSAWQAAAGHDILIGLPAGRAGDDA